MCSHTSLRLPLVSIPIEDLLCAALFAFFSMQGAIPGIAPAQSHEMTGAAPTSVSTTGGILSQLLVNVLILLLLLRQPRLLLRRMRALPCILLLTLLAVFSSAWSLDPLLTLRRSLPFALAGLFGIYFASRFSHSRQLAILRLAMTAVALATVAVVLLAPPIGLDHTPGHHADWQGIFTQKNACGRIMVLATAAVLFGRRVTVALIPLLLLFLLVLIMSGSRGAWIIEGAVLLVWALLRAAGRSSARFRLLLGLAAPPSVLLAGAGAVVAFPRLALALGRDATLSGRTAIWPQVFHFILQRPLFGYGYDAFWRGMQGPSLQVDTAVHFVVEHAHNGFLEICLELGVAGFLLFAVSWLSAWSRLWPFWISGETGLIAYPMIVLILIALYDLDENTLLIYNGLFWILYVAAVANVERISRDRRHNFAASLHAILTMARDNSGARKLRKPAAQVTV